MLRRQRPFVRVCTPWILPVCACLFIFDCHVYLHNFSFHASRMTEVNYNGSAYTKLDVSLRQLSVAAHIADLFRSTVRQDWYLLVTMCVHNLYLASPPTRGSVILSV